MSYSFSAKGATKALALAAVAAEFDKVVASQSIHAADREQAVAAATAFVNILPDDDEKDVSVSVSGSLSWQGTAPDSLVVTGASVNVNTHLAKREEKAA